MKNKIDKIVKQIESQNKRKFLGYERNMDFNYGYISCLFVEKIISKKQYNMLITVYASTKNNNCDFFVKNGKLRKHND